MNNFTLLQFCTKNLTNVEYIKISKQLCKQYSKLHNYQYKFQTINNNQNNIEGMIKKLYIIYKHLKNITDNEYLVYLDSDIFINLPYFDLNKYIENPYQIYLSIDSGWYGNLAFLSQCTNYFKNFQLNNNISIYNYLTNNKGFTRNIYDDLLYCVQNPYGLNTGFIIIQKTPLMLQFFKTCIDYSKIDWYVHETNQNVGDQNIISYFLLSKKYFNKFKLLPLSTQGNPAHNNNSPFGYSEDKFLTHVYGKPTEYRNDVANFILNKWKEQNLI